MRVGLQDRATADAVGLGFNSRWRANAIAQAKQPADLVARPFYGVTGKCRRNYSLISSWSRVRVPSLPHQWQSSSEDRARIFLPPCCLRAPPFSGECEQDYIGSRGSNPRRVAKRETSCCSGRPPFRHRSRCRRNYIPQDCDAGATPAAAAKT